MIHININVFRKKTFTYFVNKNYETFMIYDLQESRRILTEAYKFLRHEPEILPEGKIAIQARNNIRDMDIIIKTLCQNSISPM